MACGAGIVPQVGMELQQQSCWTLDELVYVWLIQCSVFRKKKKLNVQSLDASDLAFAKQFVYYIMSFGSKNIHLWMTEVRIFLILLEKKRIFLILNKSSIAVSLSNYG